MATPFSNIFTKFLKLLEDREIAINLTDEQLTDFLFGLLNLSSSVYFKKCVVDLTDYEEPNYYTKSFTGDESTIDFVIDEYPTNPDADAIVLICEIDDVATDDYIYTVATKTFTMNSPPALNTDVEVGFEFIGQYNETLSDEECWILAYAMIIGWLSGKLFNPSKLKDRLSLRDWNSPHSPANLLKELKSLYEMAEVNLRNLKVSYSFNDGHNF